MQYGSVPKKCSNLELFDRFQKFKRLNWLEFNFLLIGHTHIVRFKLPSRQQDQQDKIAKKKTSAGTVSEGS